MQIATKLGLSQERFCKMCLTTKMLLSNVIGHAAELQYEKFLINSKTQFKKAPVDKHYDYIVKNKKEQVKRYDVASTNLKQVGVNLTQTHGDRSAQDAFYKLGSFDRLVVCDLSLKKFLFKEFNEIPRHPKYPNHLNGKIKIERLRLKPVPSVAPLLVVYQKSLPHFHANNLAAAGVSIKPPCRSQSLKSK